MAQFDFPVIVPTTDTGTTLSEKLNKLIPSLYTTHSGAHRPSYAVANQLWVSTATPTEHKLYLFDGTQDQLIASFDPATINSLRTGDGLSKADGGTVVKPVTFDAVTNPKKGVMGRTDAPKSGEIGEIVTTPVHELGLADFTGATTFKSLPVPSAGVWILHTTHTLVGSASCPKNQHYILTLDGVRNEADTYRKDVLVGEDTVFETLITHFVGWKPGGGSISVGTVATNFSITSLTWNRFVDVRWLRIA